MRTLILCGMLIASSAFADTPEQCAGSAWATGTQMNPGSIKTFCTIKLNRRSDNKFPDSALDKVASNARAAGYKSIEFAIKELASLREKSYSLLLERLQTSFNMSSAEAYQFAEVLSELGPEGINNLASSEALP